MLSWNKCKYFILFSVMESWHFLWWNFFYQWKHPYKQILFLTGETKFYHSQDKDEMGKFVRSLSVLLEGLVTKLPLIHFQFSAYDFFLNIQRDVCLSHCCKHNWMAHNRKLHMIINCNSSIFPLTKKVKTPLINGPNSVMNAQRVNQNA